MAARRTSSGAQGLVLYDADEWRNKVHLYDRDCLFLEMDALPAASAGSPQYLLPNAGYHPLNKGDVQVVRGDDVLDGSTYQHRYDASSSGCKQSRMSKSIVGVDALPAYSGGRYRSISLPGQPFSFAGDVTLTTVRSPDGSFSIRVDRLYGDQSNEYTMVNVLKDFPTAPPFATLQMGSWQQEQMDALPVPYAFNDEAGIRHPSVSSQSAVYFAVNPSTAMLEGFQRWCSASDDDPLGVLQLQVFSSYGGIRLWRIEPFTYCPAGDDGRAGCGPGHVRFVDLPSPMLGAGVGHPNDATSCQREFTVKVTSLEYLNSDNVAVTYLSVRLVDYNIRDASVRPGKGRFRILYYNPRRNALRETPWHKDVGVTATAEGRLCPAMRRFPAVGSLVMEAGTVGVNLLRFFLRLTLSLPGAVHMWMSGRRCPAISYGHTLVETGCGADLLSLSEVWESIDRASAHFWRTFSIVAASIGDMGRAGSSQAANFVEGASMVGQSSSLPFVGGFYSVARSMKLPVVETSNTILRAAFSSGPGKGGALPALGVAVLAPNPLKLAQYSYELVAGWVARLLPLAFAGGGSLQSSELVAEVLHATRDSIIDSRKDFDRLVLSTMLQGCSGLSLMLGFTSPWAVYIRRQCETVPHAVNGTLSVLLLTTSIIPFVQCMCVPATGFVESFEHHVMRQCYRMSPEYLRGFTLGVVDSVRRGGTPKGACQAMLDLAKAEMSVSMQPWFNAQFMAAQALGPSVSYLADYFDPQGAMCGDSEKNPFSAVLIPEPYDFWGACGATSLCKTRCFFPEQAFEQEVARLGLLASQGAQQTVSRTVESRFFESLDSDAFAPFSVLAMIQLQDCSQACSSTADEAVGTQLGNQDSCIAVAGVGEDSMDITVHHYCVPVSMGLAVYRQESLSWVIRGSHEFLSTVVDIFFSDTSGGTVLLFRDNSGTGMPGPPAEFMTVHDRGMYSQDPMLQEGSGVPPEEIVRHLLVTQIDDYGSLLPVGSEAMSVSHLYVLPQSLKDSRPPWAFARISLRNGPSQAKHLDLCWPLYNMQGIVSGKRMQRPPGIVCGAARVLEDMVTRHHVPLLLSSDNSMQASVAMLPTQAGMGDLCVLRLAFHGNGLCQVIQPDSCFHAPHSFIGSIGTSAHAVDRSSISIVKDSKGPARRASVIAHSAASRKTRLVCQNSLSPELSSLSELRFFVTHDPRSLASWLSLSRVQLTGGLQLVGSSSPSQPVNIRVTVLLSCDIYSCIGCPPGRAQALCLSAQQCRIERCVGSPVDMRSPLCNTGITMQKIMESYITAALGGWIVFVETYSSALQLAFETDDVRQLRIESLDDAFFSQICTAKDLAASGTAVITSFVNKVVMGVGEPLTYDANRRMQASGDLAVGKFGMQSTMIAHGINGMLYQLTLLPLFLLVGVQKVYVCGGRQVMAAISTVSPGFEVTLGRADLQRASDRVTGSCVASFATRCVDSMGEAGSEDCVVGASSGILSAMQSFSVGIMSWIGPSGVPLDTLLHTMDASISFMEGFVTSLQALVQVVDTENCKAPDFFAHKVVKCACGDDPVRIPAANRSQGLADFAHWCSGTLQIPTVAGDFVYVLNPFSYEEITSRLGSGNLDDYLQCISGSPGSVSTRSCHTLLNSFQEFSDQQISPLSVLQACRDNYHAGRWDPGAWVLYDEESLRAKADGRLLSTMTPASIDDRGRRADSPVGRCLLDAGRRGEPPTLCMQEHLATTSANAFRYHSLSAEEARLDDSLLVDACVVFSGPARDPRELSAPFKACADGFTENGCRIPAIAWSVGSRNNVPVAREHVVDSLTSQGRTQVADAAQADAQSLVVPLLQGLLDFEDENLEVLLFSADGDALHQGFDCFVMGPYSRIDFWAGARSHALAVPFWARDAGGEGESRSMDLPCSLEKLQGDHLPPFTCGSPTRRSIIKSFVRGLVGDKKKGEVTLLEKLVQERIAELLEIWGDGANYECVCDDGFRTGHGPHCCRPGNATHADNYLPPALANVSFDILEASVVSKAILDQIVPFWESMHTEKGNSAFLTHTEESSHVPQSWDWGNDRQSLQQAVSLGLFCSYQDVVTHSSTEAGFPFKFGGTLWDACAGLVSQVMFSIPMREIRLDQDASEGVHAAMWTISSVQELRDLGIPFDPALDVRFEDPDSDGDTNPGGGGMLERYVSRLLRGAYESSPLFWHHALRHVPSPSLACRGQARQAQPARRHLEFKDPNGLVVDGMGPLPPVPIHGYASFPVGGFGVDCFCGWPQDAASRCVIPGDACSALVTLRLITACEYDPGNQSQAVHTESLLLRSWNASWECPEMSLSDAWGVVPSSPVALSHWLLGQTSANISSDVTELLIRGRAGLRVGNIRSLARGAAGEQINPTSRRHPARSPDGKSSASLRCRDEFLGSFDAASVARRMVDDLFPASQAVSESPVTSACLRFTVEYSRLRIVEMLSAIRDTSIEAGEQDSITNTWRRRCEVQLDMMGMCRAHGVFQMIPREKRAYDCPFSVTDGYQGGGYYVTPGCLVYKREEDAFFDPCGVAGACSPAQGPAPMSLASITKRVPFDPRRASRGDPIGYWPIRFEAGDSAVPSRMDSVRDLLQQYDEGSPVPRGLTPDFVHNLVHRGGANSPGFGNVPEGRTWGTSEGMASESTHMCDGISDWWPEDWNQPVGYHVTLPCHSSEAGYRTFDSAFAVEDTGDTVRMIYYHGALRDRRSSHSEFGGSGFCRRGSYGMPRALTNTMRVCVRDAHLASYDAHVPLHPTYGLNRSRSPQFSEERLCAGSPYDVPWTVVDEDAAPVSMLSVGGVPMWDGVLAGMSSYPSANYVSQVKWRSCNDRHEQGVLQSSRAGHRVDDWGERCHEGSLSECDAQHPCASMYPDVAPLECVRGVCVRSRALTGSCYSHADCEGAGELCTGDGFCTPPVYQVENGLAEEIEFQAYSRRCEAIPTPPQQARPKGWDSPSSFDTFGASPWEALPDILRMHGLCSYRDWYEHLLFFDGAPENHTSNLRAQCQDAQACSPEEYDGGRAMWWDTDLPKERDSFDTLWTSGRFRMLAHACDRDYMHLDGMQGCVPRLLEESGSRTDFVDMSRVKARPRLNPRGRIMRTFGKDKFIPMVQSRAVPGVTDSQYASSGFMSMQEVGGGRFTPCREVAMCREDTFRVAGEAKARQSVGPDGSVSAWQQSHSISCGMYGRLDSDGGCSLDLASLPFYWALCKGATGRSPAYQALWARVGEDCSPFRERTEMLCSVIDDNFKRSGMTATQLGSIRDALNHLADALGYQGAVRSQESYLARASCSQSLHDLWQLDPYGVRGLYGQPKVYSFHVFFSHTTLEVPIAFWFKCIVLEGRTIHTQGFGDRSVVDCEGWTGSRSLAQVEMQGSSAFEIDPLGALKSVDGIVTRSHLQQGLHEMGVRVAHKLYRHGTDYSRKGASNGHSMLCHHRPRFKPKEQTTRECMASIVKWAQRHSSFDHQLFIEANGRTEFPGGVARSCYEFAEPMVHDGATGRKEINLKYAYRKLKIDGQGFSPQLFEGLPIFFNITSRQGGLHRPLDFASPEAAVSRSGVLFAEFDAPELPRFNLVGARFTRNFVNGEYDTETPSVREDYAHDLPCYKAEEISGFVEPCPPSPDRPVVLNGSYCQQHADAMKRRVQTLSKDLLGLQTAFENGDLNVGKYMGEAVLNEQDTALIVTAAVAAGFFALATGGAGTFAAAATVTAVASTLGSEKEVDPPDPVPVYPESLVESMFRAIDAQALQCSLDMMTPGVHYCQTAPGEEREGHAFTRLGPAQNSFTKALYQNEFAFSDSPQDQTAQRKGGNPFANTPYGQSFPPDPSRVRAQYAAGLSESESRSVNAQRARIVTGSANNVERVMEEGRKVHYYDCTTELKDNVCIDPGIPLHAGNLNKNIHTSAGVSRVNGENGCLWAGLAVGEFNCAWYFDDGLRDDLHRLLCLATDDANGCDGARMAQVQANNVQCPDGFLFTSPVSGLPISRGLDCQRLAVVEDIVTYLDDQRQPRAFEITKDTDRVFYTIYMRMIAEWMHSDPSSGEDLSVALRPFPSGIFDLPANKAFHPDRFPQLDVGGLREQDSIIGDYQDCQDGVPAFDFSTCSDDFMGVYDQVREDTDRYNRKEGPVLIHPGNALVWEGLHASHFLHPSVPAWASARRPGREVFAHHVLDRDERCKGGSSQHAVCSKPEENAKLRSINPWLGGEWNPYESCDTRHRRIAGRETPQEVFYSHCSESACSSNPASSGFYVHMPMPSPTTTCFSSREKRSGIKSVSMLSMARDAKENLCYKAPLLPAECTHPQGMLLGLHGSSQGSLYNHSQLRPFSGRAELAHAGLGLFVHGGNPVYFTGKGSHSDLAEWVSQGLHAVLNMHRDDIGGHHLVLRVQGDGAMAVDRVPLGLTRGRLLADEGGPTTAAEDTFANSRLSRPTHGVDGWRSGLRYAMLVEEAGVIRAMHPPATSTRDNRDWSCPLRRIAFWNRIEGSPFSPLIPSPPRAARLFGRAAQDMMYGTRAHPTARVEHLALLGDVFTSNGFCFCHDPQSCRVAKQDWALHGQPRSQCGLYEVIRSLVDRAERDAVVLDGTPCVDQLDWPFLPGSLRDGMAMPGRSRADGTSMASEGSCNVLDRLPSFRYSYQEVPVAANPRPDRTSHSPGGACHMGRAASHIPVNGSLFVETCRTVERNATHVRVRCENSSLLTEDLVLVRKTSAAPDLLIQSMRKARRRCDNGCSPPPKFYDHLGREELPGGPEVSYGLPFRWSASRMLAKDVLRSLCGPGNESTAACASLQNAEQWQIQRFLDGFFESAESLVREAIPAPPTPSLSESVHAPARADESLLWDGPDAGWVLCDPRADRCYGKISREEWLDPSLRMQACQREIRSNGSFLDDVAVGVNLCDLNDRMDSVCRALQQARQMVIDANCLTTGECVNYGFVYSPSSYSAVNNDFSRFVVEDFYELHNPDPSLGAVCPREALEQTLHDAAMEHTKHCASRKLQNLQVSLHGVRMVVHLVVQGMIYLLNVVMTLLRFLLGGNHDDLARELEFWFSRLWALIEGTMKNIADVLYRLIFQDGLGKDLVDIMNSLCEAINLVWATMQASLVVVQGFVVSLLDGIASAIAMVPGSSRPKSVDDAIVDVQKWAIDQSPLQCNLYLPEPQPITDHNLPAPTRCWSQYVRGLDDSDFLSCSRSDTCRKGSYEFGTTGGDLGFANLSSKDLTLCDQCPPVQRPMVRFGCQTLVKQCTCGVSVTVRTSCMTHSECWLPETSCSLTPDYSTGRSDGGIECSLCPSQPMCLITDGSSGVGRCVCPTQQFRPTACLDGVLSPNGAGLCTVDQAGNLQSTVPGMVNLDWGRLAVAPCAIVSNARTYCFDVQSHGRLAVGLQLANTDLLTGGRRLLGMQEGDYADEMHDSLAVRISQSPGWNHSRSVCKALVVAHMRDVTALGVLDLQALQRCVHWREVARDAILLHNLTALDGHDTLLLGWDDLLLALNSKGVLESLLVNPLFWATIASHSSLFTPALQLFDTLARRLRAWQVHASDSQDPWLRAISGLVSVVPFVRNLTRAGSDPDPVRSAQAASQLLALEQVRVLSWATARPPTRANLSGHSGSTEDTQGPTSLRALASPRAETERDDGPARALLSIPGDVATYSGLTSALQGASDVPLSNRISELWTQGPLSWPPHFDRHLYSTCTAGEDVLDTLVDSFSVLEAYYRRETPVRRIPISFADVLPVSFTQRFGNQSTTRAARPPGARDDLASQALDFFTLDVMGSVFGLYPSDVRALLSDPHGVRHVISSALSCDFEAVTLCSHQSRNLVVSLVLSLLVYLVISTVAGSLGIPGLGTVVLLAVPALAMYISYGVSPLCIPQVPTCLLDDLVDSLTTIIPGQISWPDALQVYPQCLGPTWRQQRTNSSHAPAEAALFPRVRAGTADCLLDCRAGPFLFDGWESNAAWLACGIAPSTCPQLSIPYFPRFQARASLYSSVLRNSPQDVMDAHSVCNGLTFVWVLPYLFLSILVAYLLASIVLVPLQVVPQGISLLVNVVGYNHADTP